MTAWRVAQAKARFSEVLDKVESEGPQLVRRRKQEFFVMTKEQMAAQGLKPVVERPFVSAWDALRPSFDERFDVEFPRLRGKSRKVDFG